MWTALPPASWCWPLPPKAIDSTSPCAPSPSSQIAGYFIVSFEPRLPSTPSILPLAQAAVHVLEDHALGLQVFLELVVDDLGLVLGADAGQVVLLRLWDAELVPGVLDLRRQVLPGVGLLLGRADVIEDVVEVDLGE